MRPHHVIQRLRPEVFALLGGLMQALPATAVDLGHGLSIGGVIAGAWQAETSGSIEDVSGGAMLAQPELALDLTDRDRLFVKLGFGIGNGIVGEPSYSLQLTPWAADLEDDVKNINGRGRDHLLTAWYRHRFGNSTRLTVGIIDATDYLDDNAFANDEFHQFFNEIFVNASGTFFPSYDPGAVFELEIGNAAVDLVAMDVGTGHHPPDLESRDRFQAQDVYYVAAQLSLSVHSSLGTSHLRLVVDQTSDDLAADSGVELVSSRGVFVSLDSEIGPHVGVFLRTGRQLGDAAITFGRLISGGVELHGRGWPVVGIALGRLDDGSRDVRSSTAAESYVRWDFGRDSHLSLDVQYLKDRLDSGADPRAWIFGARWTTTF